MGSDEGGEDKVWVCDVVSADDGWDFDALSWALTDIN
jgi:hypothetical protein